VIGPAGGGYNGREHPHAKARTMFNFRYEKVGKDRDIVAVVLTGKLDEENCSYLLDCVEEEILDGRRKLILDCGQLTYVSSMGLGMLVRVNARMKKLGGDAKLAAVHGAVAQVIGVVGLNRIFQIYPTVDDAIAAHGG
jgi:anti-sigma B factor antagonist